MCTEKEDLLTVYFWVWREGLRQQLHLLHCMQLNGRNLWKQIFWTSGHQCCKESWQNGMKSRHSQETVIKFALEGKKVAPANMCWCAYMDATTLLIVSIYTVCVVVVQSLSCVWLFATPWNPACQVSLSLTISWSLFKLMSIESVMASSNLILCCPLLLLPSIFQSIKVFSKELALRIRWSYYWSLTFSISPSNEYSGLISFRIY